MHVMAAVARRFAVVARGSQRSFLAVHKAPTSCVSLGHVRLLSTASSSAAAATTDTQDCYQRIVNKMVTLAESKNFEIENVEEKIESTVKYLEERLEMSRMTAIRTVALHPMITSYTEDVMERKLRWLKNLGIDDDSIRTIIKRHPMILGRSEETLKSTKEWFLDQGIAPSKIPFMFTVFPHAVSFSLDTLNSKVNYFRDLGLDDDQIRRVLQRFPQVLTGSVEKMAVKVEVAKSFGLTDREFAKMVTVVPEYLSLSMDQVKRKIRALDSLFGEGQAVRVWAGNPRVIMCKTEELRRSYEYLTKIVGFSPDRISSHVSLIMRNVDRLIRPRYEYLKKIQSPELETVRWIHTPESVFVERFPDYPHFRAHEFEP